MPIVKKPAPGRRRRKTQAKAIAKAGSRKLGRMRVSDSFKAFVLDQLEELGGVTSKAMFGGVGLYRDGTFFAIIAADVLYFKVDETNRSDYERAGSKAFKPYANRSGTMRYWAVPLGVLESGQELASWAGKAEAVAKRAATAHRGSRAR